MRRRLHPAALGAKPVEADLWDAAGLRRAMAGHEVVINLATHIPASTRAMLLPWAWPPTIGSVDYGSAAIATAARAEGVERMIEESFAPIYPDHGDE